MTPISTMGRDVPTAVMGTGQWGRNLVRVLASLLGPNLVWLVDPDPNALLAAHMLAPRARAVRHIAHTGYDFKAVVICTPARDHFDHAHDMLERGKDLLLEKPFAMSADQASTLLTLARENGTRLMVGHQLLYHPAFVRLMVLMAEGVIGPVRSIEANRGGAVDLRREPGVVWSYGPHDISMILALMREQPSVVRAAGRSAPDQTDVPVVADIDLSFSAGRSAHVHLEADGARRCRELMVTGESGRLLFDDTRTRDKLMLFDTLTGSACRAIAVADDEPLVRECAHFLECIASGGTPLTDSHHALNVTRVLEAISAFF